MAPGSELARILLEISLQGTNWPRSENAATPITLTIFPFCIYIPHSAFKVSIHTASRVSRVASFAGLGLGLGLGLVRSGLGLGSGLASQAKQPCVSTWSAYTHGYRRG